MKVQFTALVLACVFFGTACNTLTPLEEQQYENLIRQGAEPIQEKDPAVAGALNLLVGIGDLYNGQYGAFALDLLLWWPSVVWAVPQGIITARNTNKKATITHYTVGPGVAQGYDANRGAPRSTGAPVTN